MVKEDDAGGAGELFQGLHAFEVIFPVDVGSKRGMLCGAAVSKVAES